MNGHANGSGTRLQQGAQALEMTYTRRSRSGQPAGVVRLGDVDDDVESRCVRVYVLTACIVLVKG